MSQRYLCPSMGAIRRPLARDVAAVFSVCSRAFHGSARRLEDEPSNTSPTTPASTTQREPRKVRNANAASAITSLSNRRPLQRNANVGGGSPPNVPPGAKVIQPRKPLVPRSSTGDAASPPGTMVRAPSELRITRNAQDSRFRGPNLARGRGPSSRGPPNRGSEGGPKRRDRKAGSRDEPEQRKGEPGSELPDGLVQHLLRLQRKEWDRVSYQPKYAPGSFAANELIHTGRELFKGDVPPIKVWGPLEKTLGIVGMHRGEAHLQVRRVLDGDAAPFGKEEENLLEKPSEEEGRSSEAQAVQA